MKVLKDNTGIHSAARCCEGFAKSETDVYDFLQLATELIFCEEIFISTYEPESVRQRTANFRSKYQSLLAPVTLQPFTRQDYAEICRSGASKMQKDYEYSFPRFASRLKHGLIPDIKPEDRQNIEEVHRLVIEPMSSSEEAEIIERSLNERAAGVTAFFLAANPALLKMIREHAQSYRTWTTETSLNLISDIRFRVNEAIASFLGAGKPSVAYAPAVARARNQRARMEGLVTKLSAIMTTEVKDQLVKPVMLPTVMKALVIKSKGEPQALLSEVAGLRKAAEPLRKRLSKFAPLDSSSNEWKLSLQNELESIGRDLHARLEPKSKPRLREVFEYQSVLGVPIPLPNLAKATDFLHFLRSRRRIAVLSELSATIICEGDFDNHYKRLKANSMKSAKLNQNVAK